MPGYGPAFESRAASLEFGRGIPYESLKTMEHLAGTMFELFVKRFSPCLMKFDVLNVKTAKTRSPFKKFRFSFKNQSFLLGFLPCFGPCYVNFYGSTREYSDLPDEHDDLNKGRGEGCGYRGRALVEIDTRFGDHAKKPVQDIMAQELVRVQTYMRRRKYKLFASFMSANMLCESDGLVEFEVSIGNYGNKLDSHTEPQSSSTPPTNPVYDGNSYYFLPWQETKPCCVVESHWEDIAFRLEPINCLLKIITKMKKNIKAVELALKARKPKLPSKKPKGPSDEDQHVAALLISLLDQFITDVRYC